MSPSPGDPSPAILPESLAGRAYRRCSEGDRRWCLLRRLINLLHFWKIDYCAGRHYQDLQHMAIEKTRRED